MLKKYKDPYAVELKGERSLVTASPSSIQKFMKNTSPIELMKLHDKIIRIENAVAGLSEGGIGLAKSQFIMFSLLKNGSLLKMILCLQQIIIQDIFQAQ